MRLQAPLSASSLTFFSLWGLTYVVTEAFLPMRDGVFQQDPDCGRRQAGGGHSLLTTGEEPCSGSSVEVAVGMLHDIPAETVTLTPVMRKDRQPCTTVLALQEAFPERVSGGCMARLGLWRASFPRPGGKFPGLSGKRTLTDTHTKFAMWRARPDVTCKLHEQG